VQGHWLPRYLDWICAMPEHKFGTSFQSIAVYAGGYSPPNLNEAQPQYVLKDPCAYTNSQRAGLLKSFF